MPDVGSLASSTSRASVIVSSSTASQSPQISADVSGQEVVSMSDSSSFAQLPLPSQFLGSPLQRTRDLDVSLIPFRRQMEIVYNESFIPDDLNSCQMLLREMLVNHFDISQYASSLERLFDGRTFSHDFYLFFLE